MDHLIAAICRKEGLTFREIQPLAGGQVNQVYRIDDAYVLRIGARADARQRLQRETELIRSLPGGIPAPQIAAFGELESAGGEPPAVYQIQRLVPGQKLVSIWKDCSLPAQESIIAELAAYLKLLHSQAAPHFGSGLAGDRSYDAWADYLSDQLRRTLAEIAALQIRTAPGFVELARDYFDEHKSVLHGSTPVIVHGDLSGMNILVDHGRISALLDFEYALQAPKDYELLVMEEFCLYPNDYAEEDSEIYCAGDFAAFLPLLRRHDPELFAIPDLRMRVDLYHLVAALSSYLAWRKDNLGTIPADRMAAKDFYMARITNFIFRHGVRLF